VSIDRILLAFLVDAYDEETVAGRERTVLRLHPRIAPVKAAILPLIGKSSDMVARAKALQSELRRRHIVEYDDGGAIGRRYRRQDEIGTPFAFTIDEQTLEDDTVTVRDRDSLAQRAASARRRARLARRRARAAVADAQGLNGQALSVRSRKPPWYSYDDGDDAQCIAQCFLGQRAAYASANGAERSASMPCSACRAER
jgi:hypothetical protein